MIKHFFTVGALLTCAACTKPHASTEAYCNALDGSDGERQIDVTNLYVFGDYQHGVTAVTKDCPILARRVRLVGTETDAKGTSAATSRVSAFKRALLLSPKIKSGMFNIDAVVYIEGKNGHLNLKDVRRFEEVSRSERDEIFRQLPNQ